MSSPQPSPSAAEDEAPSAELLAELSDTVADGRHRLAKATTLAGLELAESAVLGKRGAIAALHSRLGGLVPEQRRTFGRALNSARDELEALVAELRPELGKAERSSLLSSERLDLTEAVLLAESEGPRGHRHLVTQTQEVLEDIFVAMGYAIVEGREAETDWHNFEALNMPPDHPARGMFDTFYLDRGRPESILLRTHTSPVQIHLMATQPPPIRAVVPGQVYRRDTPDARHLPVFHQIEGLVVGKGITFGDLAGTIEAFTTAYFGPDVRSRLRPSYFPFTEPSAEFDVSCPICGGKGCRTCSGSGWLELGGAGMVDPNVFDAVGIYAEEYSGFAFGFGIERLAQVRTGLPDARALLDNDVRFLEQF
ncbi:MAG: phenylalanine--tRNA ligase subunit alpha [Acidimicrobiales bacterium]